jgi:hypothetical protein
VAKVGSAEELYLLHLLRTRGSPTVENATGVHILTVYLCGATHFMGYRSAKLLAARHSFAREPFGEANRSCSFGGQMNIET